jgi:hypothetical protein
MDQNAFPDRRYQPTQVLPLEHIDETDFEEYNSHCNLCSSCCHSEHKDPLIKKLKAVDLF